MTVDVSSVGSLVWWQRAYAKHGGWALAGSQALGV